ncbi:N-acetylglucosamine-6-phosphate deacetylase [Amaricoccus sp.]|uniref:N-acetylglucosamine-6-phosphate deacetylase n=1 Tax=Amaricoccus sp. TaxID=1872485 RepID=UPI001B46CB0D|nr:N-acetylglucosamine-6-phosphate deacetylase [Amaricoccus sp.]MBP7002868.1 N-acetylglucosamine-6-phosphate deacetylase [Amaricoccus sp.]
MSRRIFTGATVFDGARLLPDHAVAAEDGHIAAVLPAGETPGAPGEVVRLAGGTLAPGFLDLQVNGGDGIMLDGACGAAGIARICAAHGRLGTTGLLPTLITDTPEATAAVIAAGVAAAEQGVPGFLGLHLEGPHLDPRRKGAHDPALIRPMTEADVAALSDAAARLPALIVTLAPAAASPAQVARLAAAGAMVSLGHADCTAAEARAALDAGARLVTHLYNAMSPLGHREPGLVGAALDDGRASAGLIADGVHVAVEPLRVALAAKRGPGALFLVTDAMAPAGTAMTEFRLGGRRILRRDGRLTLEDGTLAGADCDLPHCIRTLTGEVGLDLAAALALATAAPADVLGRRDLGRLAPGARADLVHLDDRLALRGVWRGGEPLGPGRG